MSAMLATSSIERHRTLSPSSTTYTSNTLPPSPNFQQTFNRNHLYQNSPSNNSTSQSSVNFNSGKSFYDNEGGLSSVVIDTSSLPVSTLEEFMINYPQDANNQASSALQYNLPFVHGDNISSSGSNWNEYAVADPRVASTANSLPASFAKAGRIQHQRGPSSSSSSVASNESAAPLPLLQQQRQQNQRSMLSTSRTPQKPSTLSNRSKLNPSSSSAPSISSSPSANLKSNHLPTPTQTPVQEAFLRSSPALEDPTVSASLTMNQVLLGSQRLQDNELTGRNSFPGIGQEPTTPMTTSGDHGEDALRSNQTGEKPSASIDAWLQDYLLFPNDSDVIATSRSMIPKFERTMTDIYGDECFVPQIKPETVKPSNSSMFLSPYNNAVTERLQAAQMARSNSSASSQSRGLSPFQGGESAWSQGIRFGTAAQAREHQKAKADADELAYQMSPHASTETTQTISPKDAFIEYHPTGDEQPLFPPTTNGFTSPYGAVSTSPGPQSQYVPSTSMDFGNVGASRTEPWLSPFSQPTTIQAFTSASSQPYSFAHAAVNGLPTFSSSQQSKDGNDSLALGSVAPEFPASLVSMDSSLSDTAPPSIATGSQVMEMQKPNSSADTGTYSCTYHGCSQRFATPQKLQKHKRDAHRAHTNVTPGVGSGMSTAALMARNSQSGPHRCDRVNPKTGQPCNTVFSRPYDLTRHEDTTHNIRKQKIRCALCTEEKTFSRSDALTRHMRIVHPEVDFPGKHRRRGGASD